MVWLTGLRFQSPLFGGAGEGRRREKRGGRKKKWGREDGEGITIGENMGGRENLRARSSRRSEKGLGRHGVEGGGLRWREGERPVVCPSPYFLQQMCYIITKKYCLM